MKEYQLLNKLLLSLKERLELDYIYTVGAISFDKKGSTISFGYNWYGRTHPFQKKYNEGFPSFAKPVREKAYLHAEIDSLVKCISLRKNVYGMVIARIGREGVVRCAKPCRSCYKAIQDSKLKKVYYTDSKGNLVLLDLDIPIEEYGL